MKPPSVIEIRLQQYQAAWEWDYNSTKLFTRLSLSLVQVSSAADSLPSSPDSALHAQGEEREREREGGALTICIARGQAVRIM